ncbi:MAG: COR domain-containing protein [Janthinobacterium lividum]
MSHQELVDHLNTAVSNGNTSLDLSGKGIIQLPSEIGDLTKLESLDLSNNNLTRLPSELGNLINLIDLNVKNNELSFLPDSFTKLSNLKRLHMNSNLFTEIPKEVFKIKSLVHLCIGGNLITEVGEDIQNLTLLEDIQIYQNNLTVFPISLTKLEKLKSIGIGRNKISELPIELTGMRSLSELKVTYNPLNIPPEVASKGIKQIFNHMQKHEEAKNKKFFSEAKLVFVGDGNVGKTSLIRLLQGQRFDKGQSKTDGIAINKWNLQVQGGRDVSVNIWDFGGQEIMHATHQFFLTERSVYVLVLNTREEDRYGMVEYWLKLIRSFGGDSPIIIALNKCDEHMGDVDRKGLKAKYNIHGFTMTSCKDGTGKKQLTEQIKEAIGSLEHTKIEWLDNEFNVKRKLENMKYDYISYDDYKRLCLEEKVDDDRDLISFLHDLGTVLNFKDDRRLNDTNILNPSWVTEGVYKIINSKLLFETKGVLELSKVSTILNTKAYPKNKHLFIIDMMKHFELCFDIEGTKGEKLLIPELLPIQEPDFDWNLDDNLLFQYKYDFLTSSIISRFIVKVHSFIEASIYWKNGVIVRVGENRCLIKADREEKIIYISISGPNNSRRDALSKIRFQFDLIHLSVNSASPIELIPVPGSKRETVKYKHILQIEKLNQTHYISEEGRKILISDLLAGINTVDDRKKMFSENLSQNITNISNSFNSANQEVASSKDSNVVKKEPWYKKTWVYITGGLAAISTIITIINNAYSVSDKIDAKSKNQQESEIDSSKTSGRGTKRDSTKLNKPSK